MITKCRHQSSLCKQQFNIPGFMAVLHSRFTVIACRESWTRKTLLKIIGVLSAVKLNKLPTRGDSIWTNQSQWNGTQIKKVMDLPTLLFDLSTLHVLQTNYSCRRGGKLTGWNLCVNDRLSHEGHNRNFCSLTLLVNSELLITLSRHLPLFSPLSDKLAFPVISALGIVVCSVIQ